jgi:hypothetical protein
MGMVLGEPGHNVMTRHFSPFLALLFPWQICRKHFIFKGRTLLESLTYEFDGICDGDSIIALPSDHDRSKLVVMQEWMSVTRDRNVLNDTIRPILNTATPRHVAHLSDLHDMAFESHPRQ